MNPLRRALHEAADLIADALEEELRGAGKRPEGPRVRRRRMSLPPVLPPREEWPEVSPEDAARIAHIVKRKRAA